jgi:hypothetical protein
MPALATRLQFEFGKKEAFAQAEVAGSSPASPIAVARRNVANESGLG